MNRLALKKISEIKFKDLLYLLVIIALVVIFSLPANGNKSTGDTGVTYEMELWTDDNGETVSLNELTSGEAVSLSADVSRLDLRDKRLCLKSVDTVFDVYSDGQLIYSYRPEIPRLLGASYGMYVHTISVPDNTKILGLRAEPIFQTSKVNIENAVLEDSGVYITDWFKNNIMSFMRSAITMLVGILFIIIAITNGVVVKSVGLDLFSFGVMCALLGFLGMNDTLLLQIYTQRPEIIRVLTYLGLILVPYPAVSFFAGTTGYKSSKLPIAVMILCIANLIASAALTAAGITDYFNLVSISHIIIGVAFVSVIYLMLRAAIRRTARLPLISCLGIEVFVCFMGMGADILRYHIGAYDGYSKYTMISIMLFMLITGVYLIRELVQALEEKQRVSMIFIAELTESFAKVIDMKDQYTNGHSTRVAKYTAMLSKELGCDDETTEKYYRIALLHDIGKIGVPAEILNKPGKLTPEEYEIIKAHAQKGYEALENISIMPELAVGAGSHHERPDGKGYPRGLKGDEIPRVAQIIAVADTFDAMYSDRPYRNRMNFEKAVSIIREVSGTQLTQDVVEAFLRLADKGAFYASDDDGGGSVENIDNIHKR